MKKLFLLLLFINFLNADYLLTIHKKNDTTFSSCINYYDITNGYLYYKVLPDSSFKNISLSNVRTYSIESGYYLDESDFNACKIMSSKLSTFEINNNSLTIHNLSYLGLSNEDLNFMFSLSGLFISFLFLFGLFRWI